MNERNASRLDEGEALAVLPHRLLNRLALLRLAAAQFVERHYKRVFSGEIDLDVEVLSDIRETLGLNLTQFASILGIDKGSLSNIMNHRRRMMKSTQLLILERLAMELVRPGSALCLIRGGKPQASQEAMRLLIESVRYNLRLEESVES